MEQLVALIDPGHGGSDPGALGSVNGTVFKESDLNLALAYRIQGALGFEGGTRVRSGLTRCSDDGYTLAERVGKIHDMDTGWGPFGILLSVHCNAGPPTASGWEVYTSRGQTKADAVAESIAASLDLRLAGMTGRKDYSDGDADKEAGFAVLAKTRMPAVLLECGFMTNEDDLATLASPSWQKAIARAVALGILEAYDLGVI